MFNELRTVQVLNGGSTVFTAYEYYTDTAVNFLTHMEGWDDTDNVEISTEPKLTGPGSYIISQRVTEREIKLELSHLPASNSDPKALANTLRGLMMNFTPLDIDRIYSEGSTIKRRERLTGVLTAVSFERVDQHANISLTLLCTNPLKNVYLDGSNTVSSTTL